jgi:hypothetical protein
MTKNLMKRSIKRSNPHTKKNRQRWQKNLSNHAMNSPIQRGNRMTDFAGSLTSIQLFHNRKNCETQKIIESKLRSSKTKSNTKLR